MKIINFIIFGVATLLLVTASSDSENPSDHFKAIASKNAVSVEGFKYDHWHQEKISAEECIFESAFRKYPNGTEVVKVYIESDKNAEISVGMALQREKYPLVDGYDGGDVKYKNGVLSFEYIEDGSTLSIKVTVDNHLKSPQKVELKKTYTGLRRKPYRHYVTDFVLTQLSCDFSSEE